MHEWLQQPHPVLQALLATCFTWFVTALGAASVFFRRQVDKKILDIALGFAAGVMIAASYWSLLAPASEISAGRPLPPWFPAATPTSRPWKAWSYSR